MKSILPAAVLALVFHAALLGIDTGWLFDNTSVMPKSAVVTVTMSYRQPEPVKEIKKEPVKRPKAKPEETVRSLTSLSRFHLKRPKFFPMSRKTLPLKKKRKLLSRMNLQTNRLMSSRLRKKIRAMMIPTCRLNRKPFLCIK